jgi:hypothetical protein
MTTTTANHRTQINPLHLPSLVRWLLLALAFSACGLLFVYVKNQQHFLGDQTRKIERQIQEARAYNDVLLARISTLSSRTELQRKIAQHLITLQPIQDQYIARLTPPAAAADDGILRTAANERIGR